VVAEAAVQQGLPKQAASCFPSPAHLRLHCRPRAPWTQQEKTGDRSCAFLNFWSKAAARQTVAAYTTGGLSPD